MRPTTAPSEPITVRYPDDELHAEIERSRDPEIKPGPAPALDLSLSRSLDLSSAPGFSVLVATELASARQLWPPMTDLGESAEVIREELVEFQAEVHKKADARDRGKLLKELVQIAAMCQRAAEDLPVIPALGNFAGLVAARYPRMWRNIPDMAFTSHGALARLRACFSDFTAYVEANLYRPQSDWPYGLLLDELVALATLCWCCSSALRLTLNPPIPQSLNPCSPNPCSQTEST